MPSKLLPAGHTHSERVKVIRLQEIFCDIRHFIFAQNAGLCRVNY